MADIARSVEDLLYSIKEMRRGQAALLYDGRCSRLRRSPRPGWLVTAGVRQLAGRRLECFRIGTKAAASRLGRQLVIARG